MLRDTVKWYISNKTFLFFNLIYCLFLELLRRTAEQALKDMILLLFMRLPQFTEDLNTFNIKHLKIRPEATAKSLKNTTKANDNSASSDKVQSTVSSEEMTNNEQQQQVEPQSEIEEENIETQNDSKEDFTNTSRSTEIDSYIPYGIPCIRELFRFLISLCNSHDNQNSDNIIHIALNLLTDVLKLVEEEQNCLSTKNISRKFSDPGVINVLK